MLKRLYKIDAEWRFGDYFQWQTDLKPYMRVMLVNWAMEVCADFRYQRQTFHMCIAYIDMFLTKANNLVQKTHYQTVGVCALMIASKMEEIYCTSVQQFSQITGYSPSEEQIAEMEREMFKVLGYKLTPVTLQTWTEIFTRRWDVFATQNQLHQFTEAGDASLRLFTSNSYYRLRLIYQIVDAIALDFDSKALNQFDMVACVIYLVMGGRLGMQVFPTDEEIAAFSKSQLTLRQSFPQLDMQIAYYD